ncbi:MAG: winged helix-turn-helix transcriptional regulator [Telmatospirillum sp.]|nr:winged helix-turn-helix transcriptional regulator [Telmatospirillum sp.]
MLENFETIAKAISDPSRVRMLKLLEGGELCVCQISAVLDLAAGTVSKHLSALKAAGLVQMRRAGKWAFYRPAERELNPYTRDFGAFLKTHLNDDPTILEDRRILDLVKATPIQSVCELGRAAIGPVTAPPLPPTCCGKP